jgi:hypothetical protein
MFFKKRLWLFLLFLTCSIQQVIACSLPAEPCAAIVPVKSKESGMMMVTEGKTFFYLVPQGTSAAFKVVWDPAAHNTGGNLQTDKYDWCTKAGIAREVDTDAPNGYGYFPAQAMADFFEVQGKGKVVEAFTRTTGISTGDAFIAGDLGPYLTLSGFAKPGQDSEVSTIGGTATEYPDSGLFPLTGISDEPVEPSIDDVFPNSLRKNSTVPITYEGSTIDVFKVSDDKAIQISGEGLLIEDIQIDLTDIEVGDYLAYIVAGNEATNVEIESDPSLPVLSDGKDGVSGPDFSVTFNIPTFNGNKESSKVKFKVWAPGAGFEITNIYWAWEEKVFKKSSETRVTKPAEYDDEGNLISPEETTTKEVWKHETDYKCSEQLELKVKKPAAEAGSTDFIVYDTMGPIAARFKTEPDQKEFAQTGETTLGFTLEVLDTNPYFSEEFTEVFNTDEYGEKKVSQKKDNLGIQVYYTYPCYEYTAAADLDMMNLRSDGYGLADLENLSNKTARFKSYKYTPKWVWKRAQVSVTKIDPSEKLDGSSGKYAGSLSTVRGTITIQQPNPWHQCNSGPADGFSSPEPVFKVFAISKDSAGIPCMLYDGIKEAVGDSLVAESADPNSGSITQAYDPSDDTTLIPIGEGLDFIPDPVIPTDNWSNLAFLKAKDEIDPEIQVVVFDTRTNRYHLFGTKKNVDAEFSNFGANSFVEDYSSVPSLPYLDKDELIDKAHEFKDLDDLNGLFDTYIKGPDAISTVTDDSKVGYVCQKNNRLVFYIRAFDNINTCKPDKNFGIKTLKYEITDKDGKVSDDIPTTNMMQAIEHVFRFENVDSSGGTPNPMYSLKVTAEDYSGNDRDLILNIAVMGRKLDIRTLEERRKRFED